MPQLAEEDGPLVLHCLGDGLPGVHLLLGVHACRVQGAVEQGRQGRGRGDTVSSLGCLASQGLHPGSDACLTLRAPSPQAANPLQSAGAQKRTKQRTLAASRAPTRGAGVAIGAV